MNFYGLICEFNPFHNGHEYIINQIKSYGDGDLVCLMSGNFVQRGMPAIEDKYERAKKACVSGADMVVELPCIYACSNAENFAFGAVKTLSGLGITHLVFGTENANIEILDKIADIKLQNSIEFQNTFKNEIENGINYNTALKRAIAKQFDEKIIDVLNKPNNVLAIEYLVAIKKLGSQIQPVAINRVDDGYESNKAKGKFLSASSIRSLIYENKDATKFLPSYAESIKTFTKSQKEILEKIIIYNLRNKTPNELEKFYDYNEGIEYRVKEMADRFGSLDEIINNISSPRYRVQRVNKLVLYPTLEITKTLIENSKKSKPAAKLLCIKKQKKYLLSNLNKSKINLVITNKDYKLLNKNQKQLIDVDIAASNLYNLCLSKQNNNDKKIGVIFK